MTDWPVPPVDSRAAGASPLICARCIRCHRVYAKYWQDEGWITPNSPDYAHVARTRPPQVPLPNYRVRNLLGTKNPCNCKPPPTLPDGDHLATLLERARAHPKPRTLHRHRRAALTITVR